MVLSVTRRVSNNKDNSAAKNRSNRPARVQGNSGRSNNSLAPSTALRHASPTGSAGSSASTLSLAIEDEEDTPPETISFSDGDQRILLPEELHRPAFRPISSAAISAINASLADVPIEYIQDKLRNVGQQMYAATLNFTCPTDKSRLPHTLEIDINDVSSDTLTHVLAVYSKPSGSQKCYVVLYPVHALVLTVYCANLPLLPHSESSEGASTVSLPVVPLCLPSRQTFPFLLAYLYTRRLQDLMAAILPIPTGDLSPHDYMKKIVETCTASTIMSFAHTTYSLWSNVSALGVFDDVLWRAIDYAWGTLLDALGRKTGANTS